MSSPRIVVVTSGFPRLSETFLLNELLALDAAGMVAAVFATKPGEDVLPQPGGEQLVERVHVLAEGSVADQAGELVNALDGRMVTGVHGYFAHVPAAVSRAAAQQLGVPFGFSVHARDARKISPAELHARATEAAVVVACNGDVAAEVRATGADVTFMAHGVDVDRFDPTAFPPDPFTILAVGRLVEKKGFDVLLDAMARLDVPAHLRLIGDGPQRERLEAMIVALDLKDRVELRGPDTHYGLPDEFAAAHVLVVPSVVDRSGDRDGLPNVVLEAMASGRPVIGTDVGAIASAVVDGETGYVVPAHDADMLAHRLQKLALDRNLVRAMGRAARCSAVRSFNLDDCTARLVSLFEGVYPGREHA